MASGPSKPSIGIDLGTTNSCVAVFKDGRPEVIANSQGNRITPSVIGFTKDGRIVGATANYKLDPVNTIHSSKRFIGRTWTDPEVQEKASQYEFKIKERDNKVCFEVECQSKKETLSPEEIGAGILKMLKKVAEDYLEETVEDAVITVPAYFTDSQRKATKDAGEIAGLNVIRIINEPSAAAIAYNLRGREECKGRRFLVFDLGGGTLDVSVLEVEKKTTQVIAKAGNSNLGGEDFTTRLYTHFKDELLRDYQFDISENTKASCRSRLRGACETLKKNLSVVTESKVELNHFLPNDEDFISHMSRAKFDSICQELFSQTITEVEKALLDAKITKEEIEEVILVGGSTRIPKLQTILSTFFNGKSLNKSVNPDEIVACGAAVQAAILHQDPHLTVKDMLFIDVNPLSIGVNIAGGITDIVIERNTAIPVRKTYPLKTVLNKQTGMRFQITEGERPMTKYNNILGEFTLLDLPKKKAGEVIVDLEIETDANGILEVTAKERETGLKKSITLDNTSSGTLKAEDIKEIIENAKKMKILDQNEENRIFSMNRLKSLCDHIQFVSQDFQKTEVRDALKKVDDCLVWIKENENVPEKEYTSRYTTLLDETKEILTKSTFFEPTKRKPLGYTLSKKHAKATSCLEQGKHLLQSNKKEDNMKAAADKFKNAYKIANENGKNGQIIESLRCLGHTYRMLVELNSDETSKLEYATGAIRTLSFALHIDKNKSLAEDDRKNIHNDIDFAADEFFKIIDEYNYKEKFKFLNEVKRSLDINNVKNEKWYQRAFNCCINEIEQLLKKLNNSLEIEDAIQAKYYTRELNEPKEEAKLYMRSESEEEKMNELLKLIHLKDIHTRALLEINHAVNLREDIEQVHHDPVDIAFSALDHLQVAKCLAGDEHKKVFILATYHEGLIFTDVIKNEEKAESLFQEVINLPEFNKYYTEEYQTAKDILKDLSQQKLKSKENKASKGEILKNIDSKIKKLKEADRSMDDTEFVLFLFTEFPPIHKGNYTIPEITTDASKKKAYLRLVTYYHPDKVNVDLHGEEYKVLCEKITKHVNGRYDKIPKYVNGRYDKI